MKEKFSIVGAKFRGLDPYLPGITAGKEVILVRDPGNRFDKNAIMVWIDGQHVGFIPKTANEPLARRMDAAPPAQLALDGDIAALASRPMLVGTFARSPNSGFPMVEITG